MIVLELDTWGLWEWLRTANIAIAILTIGTMLAKARRWLHAAEHERILLLGAVVLVLGVIHAGLQRALEGQPSGSWTVLYTIGLVGVLVSAILAPARPPRHAQRSGDHMPTTTAAEPHEPERIGQVAKFIVVALVAVLTVAIPVVKSNDFSLYSILSALVALAGAPAVYYIAGTRGKTVAAAIAAGLQVLLAGIDTATNLAAVSLDTYMAAALAVLAAFGVAKIPNSTPASKVEVTTPLVTVLPPAGSADIEHAVETAHRVVEHASRSSETGSHPIV